VVTRRMLHGRLLTRVVRQCGACPDAVGDCGDGRCALAVQLHTPGTTTPSVGDAVLDVPCLVCRKCLHCTTAPCYLGAAGAFVFLRALRVVTRGLGGCHNNARRTLFLRHCVVETTAERGGQSAHLAATGDAPTCRTTQRRRGAAIHSQVRLAPVGSSRQLTALPESPTPR
jgi:hypothetical protein